MTCSQPWPERSRGSAQKMEGCALTECQCARTSVNLFLLRWRRQKLRPVFFNTSGSRDDSLQRPQRRYGRFSWLCFPLMVQKPCKTITRVIKLPMKFPTTSTGAFSDRRDKGPKLLRIRASVSSRSSLGRSSGLKFPARPRTYQFYSCSALGIKKKQIQQAMKHTNGPVRQRSTSTWSRNTTR